MERGIADRAAWIEFDGAGGYTGREELLKDHLPIVEEELPSPYRPTAERVEAICHIAANLITARTSGRSNPDEKLLRTGLEPLHHPLKTSRENAGSGSPPPGMDRADPVRTRIEKEDWSTIGNARSQEPPFTPRDHPIPLLLPIAPLHLHNLPSMHLPVHRQSSRLKPKLLRQPSPIPSYPLPIGVDRKGIVAPQGISGATTGGHGSNNGGVVSEDVWADHGGKLTVNR